MKTFTTEEIRDLFNQVMHEEISFSRMVEVINERVSDANEPQYKDGDFLHSDWDNENITIIYRKRNWNDLFYHVSKSNSGGLRFKKDAYWPNNEDFRLATESEKKELIDVLAGVGKLWNADKLCIEDILPKRKFKIGDKVKIKEGISSKTHRGEFPWFMGGMDELIEKELTVDVCANGIVCVEESGYNLHEDWLEPYAEELKEGDLAIFWDKDKRNAIIRFYKKLNESEVSFRHKDQNGLDWVNAIKFESKEQYERFIKGEI